MMSRLSISQTLLKIIYLLLVVLQLALFRQKFDLKLLDVAGVLRLEFSDLLLKLSYFNLKTSRIFFLLNV